MDKVILGQGCYVEDDPGHTRPNDNQVLVGATGSGKSLSSLTPTLLHLADSSLLGSYSRPERHGSRESIWHPADTM